MAYESYAADYLEDKYSDPEYPKGYDYRSYEAETDPYGQVTRNTKRDEYGVSSYMGPPVAGNYGTDSSLSRYGQYGEDEKPSGGSKSTSGIKQTGTTLASQKSIGTVQYQQSVAPKTAAPALGAMPEFQGPEWNEREVARLTQTKAAPGVRRLRSAVERATSTPYENPNVKALSLREALGGYGQGLQSVMTGAESAAQSEYGRKYAQEYQGKAMAYQANVQAKMTEYQAAMQNYMRQYSTVGYSRNVYDKKQMPDVPKELQDTFTGNYGSSLALS